MKTDDWQKRFWQAVDEDGRSARAISLAAGLGPNYLDQARARKSLKVAGLVAVLEEMGASTLLYVLTGVKMDERAVQFLTVAAELNDPALIQEALTFFERLLEVSKTRKPDPDR